MRTSGQPVHCCGAPRLQAALQPFGLQCATSGSAAKLCSRGGALCCQGATHSLQCINVSMIHCTMGNLMLLQEIRALLFTLQSMVIVVQGVTPHCHCSSQ